MWKLKQFMPKESNNLEGRTAEIGSLKLQVRTVIAEGGFSCVYLARDALNPSKQYALKQMICQDGESLDLAKKEISVMKTLKGHPNVVSLVAHTILDVGRVNMVLLVMEFCETSLVAMLENRGAGYLEEKQILLIFRDVCNAVFALHCQSPPVAHRDLKAENVLRGADGAWKLCDFGSTSTNHKCFDRPEEMGIEEDNIRKHTTPAYRAPEMWDLYRREVISEKVDIWALGCLLYRICYSKSAFDGESKLQILNGNYHIPEIPKYGSSIIKLIKDMLQASPDSRPDITQLWFRVNELLPVELQKDLPDSSMSTSILEIQSSPSGSHDNVRRIDVMPRRSPPPPPSTDHSQNISSPETQHSSSSQTASVGARSGSPMGSFWSSQYAKGSQVTEDKGPVFDEKPINQSKSRCNLTNHPQEHRDRSPPKYSSRSPEAGSDEDFVIRFSPNGSEYGPEKTKASIPQSKAVFQNQAFNTFVAEFDISKLNPGNAIGGISETHRIAEDEDLQAELNTLKQELKQVNLEKEEMTSKYEQLSAICRSQRQEIQELKRAVVAANASPANKESKSDYSPGSLYSTPPREKIEGTLPDLLQSAFPNCPATPSPDPRRSSTFGETKIHSAPAPKSTHPKSVRTIRATGSIRNNVKQPNNGSTDESWGFDQDSFRADSFSSQVSRASSGGSTSQRFGGAVETKSVKSVETNQPAGWTGF